MRLSFLVTFLLGLAIGMAIHEAIVPRPARPAIGAERYMEGIERLDGALVWDAYAPWWQRQLEAEGDSRDWTIRYFADLRAKGARIDHVEYLGGFHGAGFGYWLYRTTGRQADGREVVLPWVIVTDGDDRVVMIE